MNAQIFDSLARDGRHAVRRLRRDWPFTAAAVIILGLGIGANTAVFSVVNAAIFREPPWTEPNRLVDVYQNASNPGGLDGNSYPAYLDIAQYTEVFASTAAALVPRGVTYQHDGAIRPAVAEHTSATYPSVLGLRPALGRWFTDAESAPAAPVVAVLGHQAWTRKFGGDPSVIGRTIRIDGVPATIVGVGPAGYNGTLNIGLVTDFWLPIASLPILGAPPNVLDRRPAEAAFLVKARLRDGVTLAQAQAAMQILGARLASDYPNEDPGKGIAVFATSDVRVHPQMDGALRATAFVLLGVVGLVLALACGNLATLLLARGAARANEVSVRLALGATRGQLVRHLMIESFLLSGAGGIAGCLLAWWAIRLLGAIDLPIVVDLSLDGRVLLVVAGVSLAAGVASGLAPALDATRLDVLAALRGSGAGVTAGQRWLTLRNALIVFQVAISAALLGGTGIFLQMLDASRAQRAGFAIDGVAVLETDPRYVGYSATAARNATEELRRRVTAIPGVQTAVVSRGLPMETTGMRVVIDRAPGGPAVAAGAIWAGPRYFELLRIPIVYGRAIDDRDRADTPRVAVVSEAMARQYFGAENAVGRRFRSEQESSRWFEVVGVAQNTGTADLQGDLVDPTPQLFYRSFSQMDVAPDTVIARTSLDAASLLGAMQREIRAIDTAWPVIHAKTMAQLLEDSLAAPRAAAALLGALGTLGLCLAGIGLYAVVAFRVARRTREIGIRMALGARGAQAVWVEIREVAVLLGTGIGLGLLLSLLVVLAIRAFSAAAPGVTLYRPAADPAALVSTAAFMGAVGLAAALAPALRAIRQDPLRALRRE